VHVDTEVAPSRETEATVVSLRRKREKVVCRVWKLQVDSNDVE
jgi:hypothetical protein